MQGNFNINLPSIPTALIRFKIQDVKSRGFNAKQQRFKDNKSYLQNRFINSFSNLYPSPPKPVSQAESTSKLSTNLSSCFRQQNEDFRFFVQDNKKNLLIKYQDKYKDYLPQIQGENKFDKGYSFPRSGIKDALEKQVSKHGKSTQDKIIDNYYFNRTQESQEAQEQNEEKIELQKRRAQKLAKKKILQPSAAFKGENRWQSMQRDLQSKIKPGPGSYIFQSINSTKKQKSQPKIQEKLKLKAQRIKQIFQKNYNPETLPINQPQLQHSTVKINRSSSMFVQGNLDRFGNQIYPISAKMNVPGPGAYKYSDSLEDKANKILILEQQRKLLRQWYNQT